jgi:hypothetical protein
VTAACIPWSGLNGAIGASELPASGTPASSSRRSGTLQAWRRRHSVPLVAQRCDVGRLDYPDGAGDGEAARLGGVERDQVLHAVAARPGGQSLVGAQDMLNALVAGGMDGELEAAASRLRAELGQCLGRVVEEAAVDAPVAPEPRPIRCGGVQQQPGTPQARGPPGQRPRAGQRLEEAHTGAAAAAAVGEELERSNLQPVHPVAGDRPVQALAGRAEETLALDEQHGDADGQAPLALRSSQVALQQRIHARVADVGDARGKEPLTIALQRRRPVLVAGACRRQAREALHRSDRGLQ